VQLFTGTDTSSSSLAPPKVMRRASSQDDVTYANKHSSASSSERVSLDLSREADLPRPKSPASGRGTANRAQLNKLVGFFGPDSEDDVGSIINQVQQCVYFLFHTCMFLFFFDINNNNHNNQITIIFYIRIFFIIIIIIWYYLIDSSLLHHRKHHLL
jgi:hypothetical protein